MFVDYLERKGGGRSSFIKILTGIDISFDFICILYTYLPVYSNYHTIFSSQQTTSVMSTESSVVGMFIRSR